MKGVLTRKTMNMDGVQFNILYKNSKCITVKKSKLTYFVQLSSLSLSPGRKRWPMMTTSRRAGGQRARGGRWRQQCDPPESSLVIIGIVLGDGFQQQASSSLQVVRADHSIRKGMTGHPPPPSASVKCAARAQACNAANNDDGGEEATAHNKIATGRGTMGEG
jgi:hypothetical protein